MDCSTCGAHLPDGAKFCPQCGGVGKTRRKKLLRTIVARIIAAMLIAAIPAAAVFLYVRSTEGEGPLARAVFFQGEDPAPEMVTFTNFSGETMSMPAFPGQIHVAVKPQTNARRVRAMAKRYGGKVIGELPVLGIYLVETERGKESDFLRHLTTEPLVLNASPNAALTLSGTEVVDLSDKGKNAYDLVPALLSSPDPRAKVILAQVDDFLTSAHGNQVAATREGVSGGAPSLRVHIGKPSCGGLLAELCASGNQSLNGLAAVIAGAQINGQKVALNMSWGVSPQTQDPALFASAGEPNSWAFQQWREYHNQVMDVLAGSTWAAKGNVLLNKSADNGVRLLDAQGRVQGTRGLDITPAIEGWENHPRYQGLLEKNVVFYGALDANGNLAPYSNHGKGVVYAPVSRPGTSFAAPQGQGATWLAWKENPVLTAGDIAKATRESATPNKRKLKVLNPKALREMASRTAAQYRYQQPTDGARQPTDESERRPPSGGGGGSWDGTYETRSTGGCNIPYVDASTYVPISSGFQVRNNRIVNPAGNDISIDASGRASLPINVSASGVTARGNSTYVFSRTSGGGIVVSGSASVQVYGGVGDVAVNVTCSVSYSGSRVGP